jgi:hypothetical protein
VIYYLCGELLCIYHGFSFTEKNIVHHKAANLREQKCLWDFFYFRSFWLKLIEKIDAKLRVLGAMVGLKHFLLERVKSSKNKIIQTSDIFNSYANKQNFSNQTSDFRSQTNAP